MTGCPNPIHMRLIPDNFPGSVWSTEDGTITFSVSEEEVLRFLGDDTLMNGATQTLPLYTKMFGKLKANEEEYDFFIDSYPFCYKIVFMSQKMPESSDDYFETAREYTLASFTANYKSKKRFVATVDYSTIFEEGTKFEFFRIDTE